MSRPGIYSKLQVKDNLNTVRVSFVELLGSSMTFTLTEARSSPFLLTLNLKSCHLFHIDDPEYGKGVQLCQGLDDISVFFANEVQRMVWMDKLQLL
jgi:hypothetical protein